MCIESPWATFFIFMNGLIGKKIDQTQAFLEDGTRVPVTLLACDNTVIMLRTKDKNGYLAVQLGGGFKKNSTKSEMGTAKGAKLEKAPKFLREIRLADDESMPDIGSKVSIADVFKPGDVIDVIGLSKGKGYAGVVKRHHFKGGPRTHGQSDRERAPGSIGQTTTPGRVYKGKRMAGRMGSDKVTIKNLKVLNVNGSELQIIGLVPGVRGSYVVIKKVGESKKFVPVFKEKAGEIQNELEVQIQEEVKPAEEQVQPEVQVQTEAKTEPEVKPESSSKDTDQK